MAAPNLEDVVADALARLEALPAEESWIELSDDGHHDGGITVLGNAAGLAQLGRILLQCARDTPEAREYRELGSADADLRRLAPSHPGMCVEGVQLRQERPSHAGHANTWRDRVALVGCGLVAAVIGIIFLTGLADVLGLIKGN